MGDQGAQYLTRDHYAAVVVGSGFGGAVAACRLAQAGVDVAVVERGRSWPPGTFPRRLGRLGSGWWWLHRHGLFDVGPLGDVLCVRAAGWGGGSLVYANVAMRPAPEVFEQAWPEPYRRSTLDPYYDLAAHMLEVTPVQPDPRTGELPPKTRLMSEVGERLGDGRPSFRPNLAVRFADDPEHPGTNRFGVAQGVCVGCAQCDIGCNYGAKNTLDLNYLALAERHGAEKATLTEVTHLSRDDSGRWVLHLHQHADAAVARRTVTADQVFLGAGALGSTEILLRSRDEHGTLPDLSDALGRGYSANGDFLAFGDGTADLVSPGTGPTITTAYGLRTDTGETFLVEDGGYPNELAMLVRGRPARRGGGVAGHDTVLLTMGRDRSDGRLRLTRRLLGRPRLHLDWDTRADRRLYDAAQRVSGDVVEALGGRGSATWLWRWFRRPVSVHHLGGCRMSVDPADGVVDVDGQVHGHPGLFVVDGAAVPAATGANPSATIAAVAERCVEKVVRQLLGDPGWVAPERSGLAPVALPEDAVVPLDLPARGAPGVRFGEVMQGSVSRASSRTARSDGSAERPLGVTVTLGLHVDDLAAFLDDPAHRLRVTGRVEATPLTAERGSAVVGGSLDLLARVGPGRRTMAYTLPFDAADGRRWLLRGHKDVWHRRGLDLWSATTRLSTTIAPAETDAGDDDAHAGVIRLSPGGVLSGLLSFRATRAPSVPDGVGQVARMLGFFAGGIGAQLVPGWPGGAWRRSRGQDTPGR